jgi:peptidoglycan/xylan/chitin deacetylase (PgdA/CDA1 family)
VFTGDEFADGGNRIARTLRESRIRASFFLTGRFYRHPRFKPLVQQLRRDGHYLGAHSDEHLLYCDWTNRDSLLVTREQFVTDLERNYAEMKQAGIPKSAARFFIPPYEWYNDSIAAWTGELGLQLINFSPGTKSTADYTYPGLSNYRGSRDIYQSIMDFEKRRPAGLNGFILLVHIGTDPRRTDKFYRLLPELISTLKKKGYHFERVDQLLKHD